MILYLDTSALVKLYAVEEGREEVERAVEEADRVNTSAVAYAEARAALARKLREGVFSEEEHREAVTVLDEDWRTLEVLSVTENVARFAGDLAERHALRGFDAIETWNRSSSRNTRLTGWTSEISWKNGYGT